MNPQAMQRHWRRRALLMLRHTGLMATAALLLCAGIVALAFYFAGLPTTLRIAVGPHNDDLKVVAVLAQQLARERAGVRLRPEAKDGGTRAAAEALDRGEADLAVVRRDIAMPAQGQVVAIFRKSVAVLIAPEGAQVERVDDLVGKRVGLIGGAPPNVEMLKAILRGYGIPPEAVAVLGPDADGTPNDAAKVNLVLLDAGNVGGAIRERKIALDAALSVAPLNSPLTADAIAALTRDRKPPTFLSIGSAEAIAQRTPAYEATEIRAGAFGGAPPRPEESLDTIGVNHYIVAHRRVAEDTVAEFTRLLLTLRPALAAEVPTARIEPPDTGKDSPLPVHPGAAAYVDGEVKTFFDRYSDFIYLGLFLVSFLGSGLAGLATYSRSGERSERMKALDKLLEVATAARSADTIPALDRLQDETDRIVAAVVLAAERNKLDTAALGAFSLALDHARQALADRRAALQGQPPRLRPTVASA